jgi:hypothetical protein
VDDLEKLKFFTIPGLELRPLLHTVRSQSDYATMADKENDITLFNLYGTVSTEHIIK